VVARSSAPLTLLRATARFVISHAWERRRSRRLPMSKGLVRKLQMAACRALAAVEDHCADPSAGEGSKAGRLPVSRAARDPELRLGAPRCVALLTRAVTSRHPWTSATRSRRWRAGGGG
jgi:hypothetical protein